MDTVGKEVFWERDGGVVGLKEEESYIVRFYDIY